MSAVLVARDLIVRYGNELAVNGLSAEIAAGESLLILGGNGAGKSSALKALTGLVKPAAGTLKINGINTNGRDTRWFIRQGVVLVPEGTRNFASLTVLENLMLPVISLRRKNQPDQIEDVFELFPILAGRRNQPAGTLSGGEQKMLAIGRGLMTAPRVLCIDEPTLGLAPALVGRTAETLRLLVKRGISVVITEHRMAFVQAFGGRVLILDRGVCTWEGSSREVLDLDQAHMALLGRGGRPSVDTLPRYRPTP